MAAKLADETLAAIFFDHFHVSDDDFACITERQSPFALRRYGSSSNVLLVCKRWMRVATPLLYETVVLRSGAQAQSLAFALKSTPSLGPYIKKLRVEGGFGAAGGRILQAARNITDIWLTLDLLALDKAVPMYKAMAEHINPRRLLVFGRGVHRNINTNTASATLCRCIESWSALRIVHISDRLLHSTLIGEALRAATRIEEVRLADFYGSDESVSFLRDCSALRIELCFAHDELIDRFMAGLNQLQPSTRTRIVIMRRVPRASQIGMQRAPTAAPIDPAYVPLQSTTAETRDIIWERVLSFVASFEDDASKSSKMNCLLVCKMFKNIALRPFCRRVNLEFDSNIISFVRLLQTHSDLARCVRSLTISKPASRAGIIGQNAINELVSVLPLLTDLVEVDLHRVRLSELPDLSETLQHVRLYIKCTGHDFVLPPFSRLTTLGLKWDLSTSTSRFAFSGPSPLDTIPLLQTLTLTGFWSDNPLISLATLKMPRLRTLDIQDLYDFHDIGSKSQPDPGLGLGTFMRAHGAKLHRLGVGTWKLAEAIAQCPNLTSLHLSGDAIFMASKTTICEAFNAVKQQLHHLDTIKYPAIDLRASTLTRRSSRAEDFAEFIDLLRSSDRFPKLRTLQVASDELWPTTEREISKSPVPGWAEALMAKGITMVDSNELHWTPRLKIRKGGRA